MQAYTQIFECEFDRKIPNVRTIHNVAKAEITIQVFSKKRKLFWLSKQIDGNLNMNDAFHIMENRAKEFAVSKLLWPKNDGIFNLIDIESFKKIFASENRSLTIILPNAIEKVGRKMSEKRIELLEKYHIDALTQTHFTPTRTSVEIMKRYHWNGIKRDAIRFAKNCSVCKMQRSDIETMALANLSI